LEKAYVRSLFDSIAHRYDLLNHLLSGGVDLYWRARAVGHLHDLHPKRILDVACGTGDFSIAAMRLKPERIVGVDISEHMLELGRRKVSKRELSGVIQLETGDAEKIRFEDGSFDAAIVAFGVRNFEYLDKGLAEMHRILAPGGRIVVLEFSRPSVVPVRQLYLFYFRQLLPFLGRSVSRHPEAYSYLRDTVMQFPEGKSFLARLTHAGFTRLREERLTFGIATVYSGDR
jgi:demethylmenaquinone methyltransferase/2-methoxy-6-polyprenyl-1,4-benzoquinol methylase